MYVLDSDDSYTAAVTTPFHMERVNKGNITVRVNVKPVNGSQPYQLVKEEHLEWVFVFIFITSF